MGSCFLLGKGHEKDKKSPKKSISPTVLKKQKLEEKKARHLYAGSGKKRRVTNSQENFAYLSCAEREDRETEGFSIMDAGRIKRDLLKCSGKKVQPLLI